MALLKLNDIGKIYVSDGNVAVGIRGVNLSFERGEFVAVTGQSGSGKSTLLNIISGMDSYEEGEMYVEGAPTSHYMQADWEEYRKKYISFIFQDYNIIDSFTVLENVELALMHIEDKAKRRERALELISRVGLTSHVGQKGSKLSGGQKQRTVIARALAKDSPIILADEPTGNLDSATSAEIIKLLYEVSRDKLLIVVTHNFEQLEEYATRHIRVFDGAIESDHTVIKPRVSAEEIKEQKAVRAKHIDIRNGITLGCSIFKGRPKLSVFLCLLLIVGTLGIFFTTSLCGEASRLFEDSHMFTPIDGRVVVTRQDGALMSDSDVAALAEKYGARDFMHYDALLDAGVFDCVLDGMDSGDYLPVDCTYGIDVGTLDMGREPEADNEVLLCLPIYAKEYLSDSGEALGTAYIGSVPFDISGVKYYADNNIKARCIFTRSGFELANAVMYFTSNGHTNIDVKISYPWGGGTQLSYYSFLPSFEVEKGKLYIDDEQYAVLASKEGTTSELSFMTIYYKQYAMNGYNSSEMSEQRFSRIFNDADITDKGPSQMSTPERWGGREYFNVALSPYTLKEMADEVLAVSYRQASLFFENERAANDAIKQMRDDGYIAVSSYETYTPDAYTALENVIMGVMYALIWVLAVLFLSFFIYLCSSRTIGAFRSDVAIMRSMGIAVKTIRAGMYVRMALALIPAFISVIIVGVLIGTVPAVNSVLTYLYPWQYALIFAGMLLLCIRVTQKQIKKLFGVSVKKALRGGAAND